LLTKILDLEPHMVTVRFGFNDHAPAHFPELRVQEPPWPIRGFLYRLSGLRLFHLAIVAHRRIGPLHPAAGSVPQVTLLEFERNLKRFVETSRAHGFRLLFIDYPLRRSDEGYELERPLRKLLGVNDLLELGRRHAGYQGVLNRVVRETGTPLLDTRSACARSEIRCFNEYDAVHLDESGARVTAELLYVTIESLGWLTGPADR
jgi:hypothetical protein